MSGGAASPKRGKSYSRDCTWFIRNATIIGILAAEDEAPESIAVDPRLAAEDAEA
jgi:hypothetical protein